MKKLGGNTINFKIICPIERKFSTWIGGSIISSLSTFSYLQIKKNEYEEFGSEIIFVKNL